MDIVKNIIKDTFNDKEWLLLFDRELLPLTVVFSGTEGIGKKMQEEIGWSFDNVMFIFNGGKLKSFRGKEDEENFKIFIENKIKNNPKFLLDIQNKIESYAGEFKAILEKIKNSELNLLDNFELEKLYGSAYKAEINLASVFQIPYYLEGFADLNVDENVVKLAQLRDVASDLFYRAYGNNYYGLFDKISNELKIDAEMIKFLSPDEIILSLKNRSLAISKKTLEQRKDFYVFVMLNKKINLMIGDEAYKFERNLEERKSGVAEDLNGDDSFIKGAIANKGFVKGIVKVLNAIEDVKKIKKGDIVVSPMTSVLLYPYLKNVSAIITDEGGLTSHAAIISRELKIPCIVGTKIATQVLKDGDLVEVDADEGIVRILKGEYLSPPSQFPQP